MRSSQNLRALITCLVANWCLAAPVRAQSAPGVDYFSAGDARRPFRVKTYAKELDPPGIHRRHARTASTPDHGVSYEVAPIPWTSGDVYVRDRRFYKLVPPPNDQYGPPQMVPARIAVPANYDPSAPTEGALPSGDELWLVQPIAGFVRRAIAEGVFESLVEAAQAESAPGIYRSLNPTVAEINAAKEAVGIAWAVEQMAARGWTFAGVPAYSGNQGIDLIFQRTVNGIVEYAAVEAKYGKGLGLLRRYNGTFGDARQGTIEYAITRIQRCLRYGDEGVKELAKAVRQAAHEGRLTSFVASYQGQSLHLIPKGWGRIPGIKPVAQ